MWSVASTVLQDLCPNQAVVGAAAGTVLSPKRGRSWSLRLGREELSLHSLGRLGHVPLETRAVLSCGAFRPSASRLALSGPSGGGRRASPGEAWR